MNQALYAHMNNKRKMKKKNKKNKEASIIFSKVVVLVYIPTSSVQGFFFPYILASIHCWWCS
jgi:hypothetical protein